MVTEQNLKIGGGKSVYSLNTCTEEDQPDGR